MSKKATVHLGRRRRGKNNNDLEERWERILELLLVFRLMVQLNSHGRQSCGDEVFELLDAAELPSSSSSSLEASMLKLLIFLRRHQMLSVVIAVPLNSRGDDMKREN